jgi:cell division protein FtsL
MLSGLTNQVLCQANVAYKIAELDSQIEEATLKVSEDQGQDLIEFNKKYLEKIREIASEKGLSMNEFNSKMEALEKEKEVFLKQYADKEGS